jgi:hypothetical protein
MIILLFFIDMTGTLENWVRQTYPVIINQAETEQCRHINDLYFNIFHLLFECSSTVYYPVINIQKNYDVKNLRHLFIKNNNFKSFLQNIPTLNSFEKTIGFNGLYSLNFDNYCRN